MNTASMVACRVAATVLVWLLPASAVAQDAPACNARNLGIVSCIADVLCLCRYEQASAMRGLQAGYRWQCDLNRPYCPSDRIEHRGYGLGDYWPREVEVARGGQIVKVPLPQRRPR